jgi:hypothetical protein
MTGLAGLYLVKNSTDTGTGPDRWGLDGMEEYHLILQARGGCGGAPGVPAHVMCPDFACALVCKVSARAACIDNTQGVILSGTRSKEM